MPFQTPPTYTTNGQITAANLNLHGANFDWFHSIRAIVHAPWISQAIGSQHYQRRKHRYLHWKYTIPSDGQYDNFIKVFVNGNQVGLHNTSGELIGPATVTGSYDFNTGAAGTQLNDFYLVSTSYGGVSGSHGTLWYIVESPLNTV